MTRRFFLAALFGTLIGLAAWHFGATAHSPIQALCVGALSAMGFATAAVMTRGRLRRKQGEAPSMLAGETALLYGPITLTDSGGTSKAWAYLSNLRLMFRDGEGSGVDMKLSEIDELRPPRAGFFSGELSLVANGRGLMTLKVPDAKRWHAAIQGAIRKK